jgi:peptidase M28-like protein
MAQEQLGRWISQLCSIERPSASEGERQAAEWIAAELRGAGVDARLEVERAHGTHLPFVLPSVLALLAGLLRSRPLAGPAALAAVAAIVDELEGGKRVLRRALARRRTYNVLAEIGDVRADRTLVFVAHHDAARPWAEPFGRLVSAPSPAPLGGRPLPIAGTLAYAPMLAAIGILIRCEAVRRAGMAACAFITVLFADIARRPPGPGANDNAAAVAVLLGLACDLAHSAPRSTRVLLVFTGAEETMLEGMDGFLKRHGDTFDPECTLVVCVDQIGWDELLLHRSEGVLRQRRSDPADLKLLLDAARRAGVGLRVAPPFVAPSDGLAARWARLRTVFVGSAASNGGYPHYHRPSDLPENVNMASVLAARRLCRSLIDGTQRAGP